MLYAWILTCMPGANANAYQTNYGGGPARSAPRSRRRMPAPTGSDEGFDDRFHGPTTETIRRRFNDQKCASLARLRRPCSAASCKDPTIGCGTQQSAPDSTSDRGMSDMLAEDCPAGDDWLPADGAPPPAGPAIHATSAPGHGVPVLSRRLSELLDRDRPRWERTRLPGQSRHRSGAGELRDHRRRVHVHQIPCI